MDIRIYVAVYNIHSEVYIIQMSLYVCLCRSLSALSTVVCLSACLSVCLSVCPSVCLLLLFQVLPPPLDYKDFIVVDTGHARPFMFSDTEMFDDGCCFDGEKSDLSELITVAKNQQCTQQ